MRKVENFVYVAVTAVCLVGESEGDGCVVHSRV